uniref:RING-type E3 ubiquitin transferase n=1 Tax=Populus trichocarpa TaxID=3694 RepID=B9GYU9_POPTR
MEHKCYYGDMDTINNPQQRKAIQDRFKGGERKCPTCGEELPFFELIPNVNLRRSIDEWKQREMDFKFQAAVSGITKHCDNHKVRKASTLTIFRFNFDLLSIFVNSCYVELKEAIVKAGAVRRIVKLICRGEKGPDAMAVLLRLSKTEALREEIGKTKDCIPLLVSLLHNDNPDVSQKAQRI